MSTDFKGIVSNVKDNVGKFVQNINPFNNSNIEPIDQINETMDFSNYDNNIPVKQVNLSIEEINTGISKEKYDDYVKYSNDRLDKEISKNIEDINKYQKDYDDLTQIGLEVNEADNYKKEYIQKLSRCSNRCYRQIKKLKYCRSTKFITKVWLERKWFI